MRCFILILLLSSASIAQSGGQYEIETSIIASGGGSFGGQFGLADAAGQSLAGNRTQGGPFSVQSGFWTSNLAPTAAPVTLSGRVRDSAGRGLPGAMVILSDPEGNVAGAVTSSFGNFCFEGVPAGGFYILSVSAKGTSFKEPVIVVNAFENIDDLEFIAIASP